MKAVTWRRWVSIAAGAVVLALTLAIPPALGAKTPMGANPGLPPGLPELPRLGEIMQRDLRSGLALHGFDPVAYQAQARAVPGQPNYELVHRGSVWRFASAANREAFRDAPEAYEPAFAGFDATRVADGHAVETDPRQFAVVGSRLFLFRTQQNRATFVKDTSLLASAEAQWQEVYQTIAR